MQKVGQINDYHLRAFAKTIEHLDTSMLTIDSYPYFYLKHLLQHKKYYLEVYRTVLNHLLKNSPKKKEEMVVIDYGSGNGLLGFFAKFCGFGKVISIDSSEEFCASQHAISKTNNLKIDEIHCGDIESFCKTSDTVPDAVAGTDVIEHIYDLDKFFKILSSLNRHLITVFTTASNDRNWLKKRKLMQIQKEDEWKGSIQPGALKKDAPFREIRRRIIKDIVGGERSNEIDTLVSHTRGLNKADIERYCNNYMGGNELPSTIQHPTNTCDPITGSWTERLLSYREYHDIYEKNYFRLSIENGYYNVHQSFPKGSFLRVLNYMIKNFEKFGNFISPLVILVGIRFSQTKKNAVTI